MIRNASAQWICHPSISRARLVHDCGFQQMCFRRLWIASMLVFAACLSVYAAAATIAANRYLQIIQQTSDPHERVKLLDHFSAALAANRKEVSARVWFDYSRELAQ